VKPAAKISPLFLGYKGYLPHFSTPLAIKRDVFAAEGKTRECTSSKDT